jgi:uncharacterized protein YecT (DUF1311 family)
MMITFDNGRRLLSAVILAALTAGCSSPQLSQGTLSTRLATLSDQSGNAALPPAALVTSTESVAQQKDCNRTQINDCAATSPTEKQLDQVYQKLVFQLGGASREKLIESQSAWSSFVEAQCGFETRAFDAGTQSSPFQERCLERLTQQRTQELESYLMSSGSLGSRG